MARSPVRSVQERILHTMAYYNCSRKEAISEISAQDAGYDPQPKNHYTDLHKKRAAYMFAMRPIIAHAKAAGEGCRGEGHTLPTDNFWYAWLIAALARGVVRNETGDRFTQQLSNMTLRQIAILADDEPDFYDT